MKLHSFMLDIDVARRALLLICTPPFRTGGAGKHAPKIIMCIARRYHMENGWSTLLSIVQSGEW